MESVGKNKVKANIFAALPYRVRNYWKDGKRNHLFVIPSASGKAADLTPGNYDTPPFDLGGSWDYGSLPFL